MTSFPLSHHKELLAEGRYFPNHSSRKTDIGESENTNMGRGSNGTLITQQKALLHQENAVTKLTMEISRKGPSKAGHLLWKRAVPLMLLAIFLFWLISYTIYIIFPESHAIVLYLHWVKYPFLTSLTNLAAFELHHHARNIIIRTEDHHHVKGWHIVPLQHAWRVNASIAEADVSCRSR